MKFKFVLALLISTQVWADGDIHYFGKGELKTGGKPITMISTEGVGDFTPVPVQLNDGDKWDVHVNKNAWFTDGWWKIELTRAGSQAVKLWVRHEHVRTDGKYSYIAAKHFQPNQEFDLTIVESSRTVNVSFVTKDQNCGIAPEMTETFLIKSYYCNGKKVTYDTWCPGVQKVYATATTVEKQIGLQFRPIKSSGSDITLSTSANKVQISDLRAAGKCEPKQENL